MANPTTSSVDWQRPLARVDILGVLVTAITVPELHEQLQHFVERGRKALVLHANVHCLNIAWEQDWYRQFLNKADILFCDGTGVRLAARLLGHRIPERITYADWTWELAAFAERKGHSFFLLGGQPGVAAAAADRLTERFPDLKITGAQDGFFDKTPGSPENEAIVAHINEAKPDLLIVGFGMPLQEKWLSENWGSIEATVALTGGAVFDYVSGNLRRAPGWLRRMGFEWLGRLLIEPRRLWRRYVIGNPRFLWRVIRQRVSHGRAQLR